jgi:flagellar assembly factor FliW
VRNRFSIFRPDFRLFSTKSASFLLSRRNTRLYFLQSLIQPALCFLALPIQVVDAEYRLAVSREDLILLDLPLDRQPLLESEVAVLVLLSLHDGLSTTANLMAPIVVNLKTRRALQAIRQDSVYSHQHAVARVREKAC